MNHKILIATCMLALAACGGGTSTGDGALDESAGGIGDGIGVTGVWHIDVLNADGTIDESIDFHNAFIGQQTLADLLSMATTQTGWYISAQVGAGDPICSSGNGNCSVPSVAAVRDGATDELVVSGSFQPEFSGNISKVAAGIVTDQFGNQAISEKILSLEPSGIIAVGAGQTVQIEIRYSFSTL